MPANANDIKIFHRIESLEDNIILQEEFYICSH